jgi:hypothetical protein
MTSVVEEVGIKVEVGVEVEVGVKVEVEVEVEVGGEINCSNICWQIISWDFKLLIIISEDMVTKVKAKLKKKKFKKKKIGSRGIK